MKKITRFCWMVWILCVPLFGAEEAVLEKSILKKGELHLSREVQPRSYFDTVGRKSAVLGRENGVVEVWIYPYKVVHNFQLHFLIEEENAIVEGKEVASRVDIYPHQAVIRYAHSSFTVDQVFFAPLNEPGVVILLSVETVKPLSIVASFTPDLKPMWPAGLGGQYSYWDSSRNYFLISEGTRKNVALVGSPCAERFSTGPAHALPEGDMKMRIQVEPEKAKKTLFPVLISASHEGRKRADETYDRMRDGFQNLYSEKLIHHEKLASELLVVETPDELLNGAFQWAKVAVDSALVCNPQLGCGLVAGYGPSGRSERPGFAWFFGGDAFFNSWAITSYGSFEVTRRALSFIREKQREDGKIMHELSQAAAFIPWFEEYPYGFYHAETTPYYIVSLHDYLVWSGDLGFLEESWPSLQKAYQYVLNADTDGDGLMENTVAGLAALELGAFLKDTKTDIYLAALSVECHRVFAELAGFMKDKSLSGRAQKSFQKALKALQEKFWVSEDRRYAHAVTVEDKPLTETTVWPFMPLFFKHFPKERADFILDLFASAEMSTDWGVRSLSPRSAYYDPLNYNYGTVWPFLTGYVCLSEYNYDRALTGYAHLMGLAYNTFIDALGRCPELFSGEFFTPIEAAVPHQVFSSSPVVTCLVRGLLGLKGNALSREIEFRPSLPANWRTVRIRNFRVGKDIFHFSLERSGDKLICRIDSQSSAEYRVHFKPSLGFGAQVLAASINGEEKQVRLEETGEGVRCFLEAAVKGETRIEILTDKSIFLNLPLHFPQVGDRSSGLKMVRTTYRDNQLQILVDGSGGKEYSLLLMTKRPLLEVKGAEVQSGQSQEKKLRFRVEGENGLYFRKEILLRFE